MRRYRLLIRSFSHHFRSHLLIVLGMAVGVTVITGALVTGDSVRAGLRNLVGIRLGDADLSIRSGERFLTDGLALRLSQKLGIPAASVLQLGGSATAGVGTVRIPKVQVFGVDPVFTTTLGPGTFEAMLKANEAVISDNLADKLRIGPGDEILVRVNQSGPIPIEAPFVTDEKNIVSLSLTIRAVAGKQGHGRLNLQNTQTAPDNVFVNRKSLQQATGLDGMSNLILLAGHAKVTATQLAQALSDCRTLADVSLDLQKHPVTGEWVLRTSRLFFDPATLKAIRPVSGDKSFYFSYFVNEFRSGNHYTPYSFVSTLPDNNLAPDDILVNRWLADDLQVEPGDSVILTYFRVGTLRTLTEERLRFRISGILNMEDPLNDRELMPEIPGLSDAGNCRDWETGIPIDLEKIRDEDEEYWNVYRGTPKAYVNPDVAAYLWNNRFGAYTQVRWPGDTDPAMIATGIQASLSPLSIGIRVEEPARTGQEAASGGTDFSGLFLGLSFFLIAGGILLTLLLIRLGLESRTTQIGTLRSLGWSERSVRTLLLEEFSLTALAGTLLGLIGTILYTFLIFKALNSVWNDIVLTDTLRPVYKTGTLAAGVVAGLVVSTGSAWLALSRFFRHKPTELLRQSSLLPSTGKYRRLLILSLFFILLSLVFTLMGFLQGYQSGGINFFLSGTLMLIALILLVIRKIRHHPSVTLNQLNLSTVSQSNIWRQQNRSLSVILLFAIGIFLVLSIGANRKQIPMTRHSPGIAATGTGGYQYFLETTVPVADNLNDPVVRATYGLELPSGFVQMKKLEGDDASCLNLNRVSHPPLLGVPEGAFSGRFRFVTLGDKGFRDHPWDLLDQELPGGAIPAVADREILQWNLGVGIGDTLRYAAENGDTVFLILAGGTANSILQGHILIAEKHFVRHWPSVSGTRVHLITASPDDAGGVKEELLRTFRDYGADLLPAAEKMARFNAIQNTYLSIFLVMGALGMLLGTIGLAIVMARNLLERRYEIALMRAAGFSRRRLFGLIFREYSLLLLFGTLTGSLPALICVLPALLNPTGDISVLFLLLILALLILNGLVWISGLSWHAVRISQGEVKSDE